MTNTHFFNSRFMQIFLCAVVFLLVLKEVTLDRYIVATFGEDRRLVLYDRLTGDACFDGAIQHLEESKELNRILWFCGKSYRAYDYNISLYIPPSKKPDTGGFFERLKRQ